MKLVPSELVGERDRIRRHFADSELTGNLARVAVPADIDEGVGAAGVVESLEHRREHAVIPKPSVNDHNSCRATAYRFVPNHFSP